MLWQSSVRATAFMSFSGKRAIPTPFRPRQVSVVTPKSAHKIAHTLYFTDMSKCLSIALAAAAGLWAQSGLTPGLKAFISVDAPVIALEHVRILDGTGAPLRED